MRKLITWKQVVIAAVVLALLVALAVSLATCQRRVKVLTGEIVICTAGEILEDNTEEIEVPEGDVEKYGVTTRVITCETHGDLDALYEAAQRAIADGDLVTARERLATIVARNPNYRNAREQLAAVSAGTTPPAAPGDQTPAETPDAATTPEPTDPGTGEPTDPGTEPPTGPIASLTTYVPDTIAGYVAQGILADPASLSRQYLPTGKDADQLVIEVELRVDAAAAGAAQQEIAASYADSRTERIIGGRTVVAGSSGQYAAAVFTDGALTIIVEIHATGPSGAGLIDAAFAVVESITS